VIKMAEYYKRIIRISVRDSCGMMGKDGAEEYLVRVADDMIKYCNKKWPGIKVEFFKNVDIIGD